MQTFVNFRWMHRNNHCMMVLYIELHALSHRWSCDHLRREADMSQSDPLIEMLRIGLREFRDGVTQVVDRIDQTNNRLDMLLVDINQRFEGVDRHLVDIDQHFTNINQRFESLELRFDGVDRRLDSIDHRLDLTLIRLEDFQIDVSKKFDGVGTYLKAINGTLRHHTQEIDKLKRRVDKLEGDKGA